MAKPTKIKGKLIIKTDQENVVADLVAPERKFPFEIWFHLKKKKVHWRKPMKEFADSNGMFQATLEDWDKFFAKY